MNKYEEFLNQIAKELDLTDTENETIINSYNAVGSFLKNSDELSKYDPNIFPQGSFRLGTVVKPLKKDDYDIDLVCELSNASDLTPEDVKKKVGLPLKNGRYNTQLEEEHGRCWTLDYQASPPYHLDILAGVSFGNERVKATIRREGSSSYDWLYTNPKGFAKWFHSLSSRKVSLLEHGAVEKVNIYNNKTPLQRAVQLIKRHRDVFFKDNPKIGPASVIITALSGLAYNNESTIESILRNGPIGWMQYIKKSEDKYSIKIPSLPDDDYADKWNGEDPDSAEIFLKWYRKLILDLDNLFSQVTYDGFLKVSKRMFEESAVDRILNENICIKDNLEKGFANNSIVVSRREETHPLFLHAAPISEKHLYVPFPNIDFKIFGYVYHDKEDSERQINRISSFTDVSPLLKKGLHLRFNALVKDFKGYYLLWQITNTGKEAQKCLRGGFEFSDSSYTKYEETTFSGTHFVQAFVISRDTEKCVAKSNVLMVCIGDDL